MTAARPVSDALPSGSSRHPTTQPTQFSEEAFFCYLIGENIPAVDIVGEYRRNVHGDWVKKTEYEVMRYPEGPQQEVIGLAHIEIMKLSSLRDRALRRNKSFADRLGISDAQFDPKN